MRSLAMAYHVIDQWIVKEFPSNYGIMYGSGTHYNSCDVIMHYVTITGHAPSDMSGGVHKKQRHTQRHVSGRLSSYCCLLVFLAAFLAYFDSEKLARTASEYPPLNGSGGFQLRAANGPLTLSVHMVKNDSVTSVIGVISVWQVGIGWIQPREYSNTKS